MPTFVLLFIHIQIKMVEVFKTNVDNADESKAIIRQLHTHFPGCKINFDLEDCDRILRIEGPEICPEKITNLLSADSYTCEILR
jgi:hypothetical protein